MLRWVIVLISVVVAGDASAQQCNHSCDVYDMDDRGCCFAKPKPKPKLVLVPPAPPPKAAPKKPLDPARVAARKQLEDLEKEADKTGERLKYQRTGEGYIQLFNADPDASDADELLYNATVMFTKARAIGSAIQISQVVLQSFPKSKLAERTLMRLATLYGQVAWYDQAAQSYEKYVKLVPADATATSALSDAAFYRKGIGDDERAIANFQQLIQLTKNPVEAAQAQLAIVEIYEKQRDNDKALIALNEYVKRYGQKAGPDRLIVAHSKIGEILLRQACPVRPVDGLCIKITRERALALKPKRKRSGATVPTQCGPASAARVTAIARDTKKVDAALAAFRSATQLYNQLGVRSTPAAKRYFAVGKLAEADLELEKFARIEFPKGLAFSPGKPDAFKRDLQKVSGWMDQRNKQAGAARLKYEAVVALADPKSAVAAGARLGQLLQFSVDTFFTAEIPQDVRTDPDATDAFCDHLVEVAEPLEVKAIEAYAKCSTAASQLGVIDESSALCKRELGQLRPRDFPLTYEVVAEPVFAVGDIELEPPAESSSAGYVAALAEYRKHDGNWSPATCTQVAKQFTAIAATDPEADYMVGLTFHRCGMIKEAQAAYAAASKRAAGKPIAGASLSNLGAIAKLAGKTQEARQLWDDAIKTSPRLIAARVNTVAEQLVEMRELPSRDPAWAKLDADIRYSLSNVLAVDLAYVKAHALLALVYMEGTERNKNRLELARLLLDEAKRIDPKNAFVANVEGVWFMRRNSSVEALAAFKSAPNDPDATLNLALMTLRLEKYDDAHRLLAALKPTARTEYAIAVATAVALRGQRKYPEAEAAYLRATKLAPQRVDAFFDLGVLYMHHVAATANNFDAQIAAYKRAQGYLKDAISKGGNADVINEAKNLVADADKYIRQIEFIKQAAP